MPKQKVFPRYALSTAVETGLMKLTKQASEKSLPEPLKTWDLDEVYDSLSADNQDRVRRYGTAKILQDRTSADTDEGPGRITSIQEVIELLQTEEWEKKREGGPGQPSALLVKAICEANPTVTEAQVIDAWVKAPKEKRESIRERYAERVAELKRAGQKDSVDLDDLS
jgi:hypothetical protein